MFRNVVQASAGSRQTIAEDPVTDIEAKANVLLREVAARQIVVDRLLGRSVWNGLVRAMTVPVIANVLFLLVWSVWAQSRPEFAGIVLGGALSALLWVSLAVMQIAGRLHALATILERSGVLAQFVAADGRLTDAGSQEGDTLPNSAMERALAGQNQRWTTL